MKILISVPEQKLTLLDAGKPVRSYPVSTSRFGIGTQPGSYRTPIGRFRIREKIGYNSKPWTCFKGRLPVGIAPADAEGDDLVLTRILWLDGVDPDNANTASRFIYIHGTPQEALIGQPASHGCIRMRNHDVMELFDHVAENDEIIISAE